MLADTVLADIEAEKEKTLKTVSESMKNLFPLFSFFYLAYLTKLSYFSFHYDWCEEGINAYISSNSFPKALVEDGDENLNPEEEYEAWKVCEMCVTL
jgi:hypothetical protein